MQDYWPRNKRERKELGWGAAHTHSGRHENQTKIGRVTYVLGFSVESDHCQVRKLLALRIILIECELSLFSFRNLQESQILNPRH